MSEALYPYYYDTPDNDRISKLLVKATDRANNLAELAGPAKNHGTGAPAKCLKPLSQLAAVNVISQHAWAAFMYVVRTHFFHLPFYLDPTDSIACSIILERHFGAETQRAGFTFLRACTSLLSGFVQFTTSPTTLETCYFFRCEMPILLDRNNDLIYDLEIEFKVSASPKLVECLLAGVIEVRSQGGYLLDIAKLRQDPTATDKDKTVLRASLLAQGLPMITMLYDHLKLQLSAQLCDGDQEAVQISAKAQWSVAYLSNAQRAALSQSSIAIECLPTHFNQDNILYVQNGMVVPKYVGGALEQDIRWPTGSLLCARTLALHLDQIEKAADPRTVLPHALACDECRGPTLEQLQGLLNQELALEGDDLQFVLSLK